MNLSNTRPASSARKGDGAAAPGPVVIPELSARMASCRARAIRAFVRMGGSSPFMDYMNAIVDGMRR